MERRTFEVRAEKEGRKIAGRAIVFGEPSDDLGGFVEVIAPDVQIMNKDVRALFNHDNNYVLGREASGTLTMERDAAGVTVSIDPPDAGWANDLLGSMRRGDITGMSFAFRVNPDGQKWSWPDGGEAPAIRTITSMSLYDVSVVTRPAYPQTDANVRSPREVLIEAREAAERDSPDDDAKAAAEAARSAIEADLFLKRKQVEMFQSA